MQTGLLQGPFPTHTCFPSQKAPPWCGQSRASEGHQEQRSGPQLRLGSGAPGSYVEKNPTKMSLPNLSSNLMAI